MFHVSIFRYLLSEQSRLRSVNDIMPMIGARFYTQLDASQMRNDVIEEDLAKVLIHVFSSRVLCFCHFCFIESQVLLKAHTVKYPLILFKSDYTSHAVFVIFCFSHFLIQSHSQLGFNSSAGNEKKHPFRPGYLVYIVCRYLVCAEGKPEMRDGVIAENILDSFSSSLCFPPFIYSYQICEDISDHPAANTYKQALLHLTHFSS